LNLILQLAFIRDWKHPIHVPWPYFFKGEKFWILKPKQNKVQPTRFEPRSRTQCTQSSTTKIHDI